MSITIRAVASGDLDALYAISLATGDAGKDASHLYADPRLIGHIYTVPYAVLRPDWSFVAEDQKGVAGYVVGTPDTMAFAKDLEARWWPDLRRRYADPGPPPHTTADAKRIYLIHHPEVPPPVVTDRFPAHMHMNLLPRAQGKGLGRTLFMTWCDRARATGVAAVHVGVSPKNAGGAAFWQACGMQALADVPESGHPVRWFGMKI